MNAGGALLANDMGTGKTISTYAVLRMLNDMHTTIGGVLPALVISPNGVKQHWAKRTPTWFPDATPYIVPNTGPVKRKQLLNEARDDSNAIVFCNIEAMRLLSRLAPYGSIALARCRECDPKHGDPALKTSRCEVHRKEFNGFGFRTVVIDEAHRVRNATSKSTRAVWSVCHDPSVERRIALTGTSIAQHVGDLWSVMHAIAPLDYPVKSKWMDRVALFAWDAMGGMEVVGVRPDRRDEFFSVLDPRYRRMPIDVVLPQLPPFVREVREVELPAAQLRMYNDIKKKLTTRTESGELFIVPNQLTKSVRLQQLAASSVEIEKPDEDDILTWKVTLKEPSPKLDELMAVLEELGDEPCAIGSEHLQLINLAAARLDKADIRYGLIAGPVSTFDRERALDDLGTGRIRVLLFTLAAGGEGIDMSAVSVLIRLQRSWQLIPNIQSERRIRRIGSEKHNVLRVIDIITAGTVEVDQIERLNEKLQRLEEVNRDRETRRAAGMTTEELDQEEMHIMSSRLDVDK
jgi:SNF2 family DNA or RNA helicase